MIKGAGGHAVQPSGHQPRTSPLGPNISHNELLVKQILEGHPLVESRLAPLAQRVFNQRGDASVDAAEIVVGFLLVEIARRAFTPLVEFYR